MTKPLVSVVVPVFNETEVLEESYTRMRSAMEAMTDVRYELIYVDDGSSDDTYARLAKFAKTDPLLRVIKFSRNFGHQIAITAGIDLAMGDAVVVIDADLQDPPEVIADFVAKWQEGYHVVYGVREKREGETKAKLASAGLFYRLLRRFTNIEIPADAGDFRLMSRAAVNEFKQLREKDRFVRGLVSWIGFPQTGVTYKREARHAGETKYPYSKMIKFAVDGIASFSTVPLRLASWLGYLTSALAFLYLASVFVQRALGYTVQGWATIMVAMLFLGGIQLICVGIMGEYIGRIFNEVKPRPMYVIETIDNPAPAKEAGSKHA
jgi:dolichol-phosphate mannosyltransferase